MIAEILDSMLKNWITDNFLWGAYIIFGLDFVWIMTICSLTIVDSLEWVPLILAYALYCLVKIVDAHRKHIKKESDEDWTPPAWARYAAYVAFTGMGITTVGIGSAFLIFSDLRGEFVAWIAVPGAVICAVTCIQRISELRRNGWVSSLWG